LIFGFGDRKFADLIKNLSQIRKAWITY